jgi:spore coat polysaccharide biosynthesis predicted glycosyltransferase SpsG
MLRFSSVPNIVIDVETGVYQFANQAGTGKTYLYSLLSRIMEGDSSVLSVTYSNALLGKEGVINYIKENKPKVMLFDRYDMYVGVFDDVINDFSNNAIILVDLKHKESSIKFTGICNVYLKEHVIEVW